MDLAQLQEYAKQRREFEKGIMQQHKNNRYIQYILIAVCCLMIIVLLTSVFFHYN